MSEIVLYQSNELAKHVEVIIDEKTETIWLTQQQMADLFGVQRPAITKHLGNIFKSGELEENVVSSILEHTTQHGAIEGKKQAQSHDRFIIIDNTEVYHLGASLKDLGKKWFAFAKMDKHSVENIINLIERQ
jgi:hypothetical protein